MVIWSMSVIIYDIVAGDSLPLFCYTETNPLASLVDVLGNTTLLP